MLGRLVVLSALLVSCSPSEDAAQPDVEILNEGSGETNTESLAPLRQGYQREGLRVDGTIRVHGVDAMRASDGDLTQWVSHQPQGLVLHGSSADGALGKP